MEITNRIVEESGLYQTGTRTFYKDLVQEPEEVFINLRAVGADLDIKRMEWKETRKLWPMHLNAVKGIGSSKESSFAIDCEWGKNYLVDNHAPLLKHLGHTP